MAKTKTKKKPKKLVKLVAIARSNGQIRKWGGAPLHVSTHTQHGITVVCGWSTTPGDDTNAFDFHEHLGSVLDQWRSMYGQGWLFQLYALDGRLFGDSETGHRWKTYEHIEPKRRRA